MSRDEVKQVVRKLHEKLKQEGQDVSLSQVYEMVSRMSGHKNWNVYSAFLKREKENNREDHK